MRVWGLYSRRVDPYHAHELIELFTTAEQAERVRSELVGKPQSRQQSWPWEDDVEDPEFSDLLVRPLDVH